MQMSPFAIGQRSIDSRVPFNQRRLRLTLTEARTGGTLLGDQGRSKLCLLGGAKGVRDLKKLVVLAALTTLAFTALVGSASASHSWGKYHWARTSNPFTLKLGDNTSSPWTTMLNTASSQWSVPNVLNTNVASGGTTPATCAATSGRVEVCNYDFGDTGWLGVAQIWIYVGGSHIAQGTVKLNDHYFGLGKTYRYNNSAEMQHVVCQEVGHTLGLDHQSTSGASLSTCMDYYHNTSDSDTQSTQPNQGDMDELRCIYDPNVRNKVLTSGGHKCRGTGHLDSFNSVGGAFGSFPGAVPSFAPGTQVGESKYVDHLPDGGLLVTWITWANR